MWFGTLMVDEDSSIHMYVKMLHNATKTAQIEEPK